MRKKYMRMLALLLIISIGMNAWAGKTLADLKLVDGFYEIGSLEEMMAFNTAVKDGQVKINGRLTADLEGFTEEYMVPTYEGHFDGQHHVITVNINAADEQGIAIFKFIQNGAVIENIGAKGSIKGSNKLVASIVGDMYESTLRNCWSTVDLYNSVVGDATSGGIVARIRTAPSAVENCIFAGSLKGPDAFKCGGLVGYLSKPGVQITNCVVMGTYQLADNDNNTFNRKPENAIYTNCYYVGTSRFATVSDACTEITAEQIANGELCFLLNGDQTTMNFYQTLGTDAFPLPDPSHSVVYSTAGVSCDGTVTGAGGYTNDADQAGKVQEHLFKNGFCSTCGTAQPNYLVPAEDGTFEIGDGFALAWFANYVNSGNSAANACLTADIDMSEANERFAPIGNGILYKGTFDGQGHIISCLQVSGNEYVGLIGSVGSGATIRCLILDTTCSISGSAFIGLIGGSNDTGTITMEMLGNEGMVKAVNQNAGGIIGVNMSSTATHIIRNCYVTGTIQGGRESAAISGWTGGSQSSITNTWSTAEVSGNDSGAPFYRHGDTKVSNNYNIYGQQGTKITSDDVTSGALCFKLNGNSFANPVWFQTLEEDEHPVFDSTHGVIYGFDDEYGCVKDGDVEGLIASLIASETAYVQDLTAQKTMKEAYEKEVDAFNGLNTLDAVVKSYNSLQVSKKALQANAAAYEAYIAKVEDTKKYLDGDHSFSGPVREALEAYLTGNDGPSEENPDGEANYIIDNELLSTDEIKAETARIDEWLLKAMSADAKPGQDVTLMLTNPDFSNGFSGWQGRSGNNVNKSGPMPVAFTYNATSNLYQTLTGLKNGIYELQMNACFFPVRSTATVANANHGATLYAGGNEVPVMVVCEDALPADKAVNGENCYIDNVNTLPYDYELSDGDNGALYYVPSHETGAAYAFQSGRYLNRILMNVTDGTMIVGLRVDGTGAGADLASYANTRLIYQGEMESKTAAASLDAVLAGQAARANTMLNVYEPSDGSDYAQAPNFSAELKAALKALTEQIPTVTEAAAKYEMIQKFSDLFQQVYDCKKAYKDMYAQTRILNNLNTEGLLTASENDALVNAILEVETAYSEGGYTIQEAKDMTALKTINAIPDVVDGFYQVGSPLNWLYYAYMLSNVSNNSKGQLTTDLDLSAIDMTPVSMFRGEFDGQGHTMNIYMKAKSGDGYAPFLETRGCYIHDLNITGRIEGGGNRKITSLIGNNKENPFTIERVSTAITITSIYQGDSSISGFVADNRDVNGTSKIKDCLSTITIDAPAATNRGGLMGWNKSSLECENVLIASTEPADVLNSSTIIRQSSSELTKFKNCYYLVSMPTKQGTQVTSQQLESGEVTFMLQAGREEPVWFQTLGEDKTPVLLHDHKLIVKTDNGYENAENAIHEAKADAEPFTDAVYDLTGRRIMKPHKGIYIINGKTVMVK